MPTVIFVDTSPAMSALLTKGSAEAYSPIQIAIHGIGSFLDHLSNAAPLEFISVVTYDYSLEIVTDFTRDIEYIRSDLVLLKRSSKFDATEGLKAIDKFVVSEWGTSHSCNILVVSLESALVASVLQHSFSFPGTLIFVCLNPEHLKKSLIAKVESSSLKLYQPELPISSSSVQRLFNNIGEKFYSLWVGSLACGNFNSKISLTPSPEVCTQVSDFEYTTYNVEKQIEICGFIDLKDVGSPGAVSRHLVLPYSPPIPVLHKAYAYSTRNQASTDSDDDSQDEGQVPSFCVLLHGALKVENMAALCQVANNWYGVIFSWADSKKKSNLMLSLLEPGTEPVAWLGDLNKLTIKALSSEECETFPIKTGEKKSHAANCVAWIRQAGFQTDIQKILRHARKIPEKTLQFYKELNRVRRAAICLGFLPLIDGLAAILDRECTSLPGTVHPACAFQLSHAAGVLREPCSRDPKFVILPMKMSFSQ